MAENRYRTGSSGPKTLAGGYLFGVPLGDLGWFASLLMGLAAGFIAFFAATFVGILSVTILNARGQHADYAWSYTRFGLPAGVLVAVLALGYLAILWFRRVARQ